MTENPSETDVAALAEQIDARPWSVEGYAFEGGSDDSFTVTLEVEWVGEVNPDADAIVEVSQRDRISGMKSLVETIEANYDEGAPISEVLARAEDDLGIDREDADATLETLRRQGDVYEASADHLRTV
jgi:hypothetical protein